MAHGGVGCLPTCLGVHADGVGFRWKLGNPAATVDEDEQRCLDLDGQLAQAWPNAGGSPAYKVNYDMSKRDAPRRPQFSFSYTEDYVTSEKECGDAMYKKQLSDGYHLCEDEHAIYVRTVHGKQLTFAGYVEQVARWTNQANALDAWHDAGTRRGIILPSAMAHHSIRSCCRPVLGICWRGHFQISMNHGQSNGLAKEVAQNRGALITGAAGVGKTSSLMQSSEPLRI